MTARLDILQAIRSLVGSRVDQTFSMAEVIEAMRRAGASYPASTVRTHIGSVMCIDAPVNHAVTFPDLERVGRGRYRLAGRTAVPLAGSVRPEIDDDEPAFRNEATLTPRPPGAWSQIDLEQVAKVVAVLAGLPLTTKVAAMEAALEGQEASGLAVVLADGVLSLDTAVAAMAVRESLGRINDLIHASVICATLPQIMQPYETITVRPSLASGNDQTRQFDLETSHRIAEFKVAVWQGGDTMRKRGLFADLARLAMDERPLIKQMFVIGDLPGRFLRGSKSEAHMILQRAHQSLRDSFSLRFGADPISVAEFTGAHAANVEVIDLLNVLPELRPTN